MRNPKHWTGMLNTRSVARSRMGCRGASSSAHRHPEPGGELRFAALCWPNPTPAAGSHFTQLKCPGDLTKTKLPVALYLAKCYSNLVLGRSPSQYKPGKVHFVCHIFLKYFSWLLLGQDRVKRAGFCTKASVRHSRITTMQHMTLIWP